MEFKNTIETLNDIGILVREQYKEKIKKGAYATGKLYNSVKYKLEVTETGVKLIFSALDYYIYVENGRKEGKFPPIDAIKRWMIAKKIPDKNGASYLISRSIAENGIKPRPYLREIKKLLPSFSDDIKIAMEKDVKIYMDSLLENNK